MSKKIRTLKDGRTVTVNRNDGLRKRCDCPRRSWNTCGHAWHFSFKPRGSTTHFRFPLDKYADKPITTRELALKERDRLRILIRDGAFPPSSTVTSQVTPSDLTFEKFITVWRERARTELDDEAKANEAGIARKLGSMILAPGETLSARPIARITEDDIEIAFGQLKVKGSTWNNYRRLVLMAQRWGVKKGYLTRPWLTEDNEQITHRQPGKRERRLLPDVLDNNGKLKTPGEERRLLAAAGALKKSGPWLQRLIIAALETCCRRGELLSLQWRDVSLTRNELTIRAENAKDDESRVLSISPNLRAVLEMIKLDPNGEEHEATDYVFGDRIGQQVADPKKAWKKACKAANITDLHFHDLRHEAASHYLEQGWPLHHVQNMLGHADLKTTSRYINATTQGLHESMKKFGSGRLLHVLAHDTVMEPQPPCNENPDVSAKPSVN